MSAKDSASEPRTRKQMAANGAAVQPVIDRFGDSVLASDGSIDRQALGGVRVVLVPEFRAPELQAGCIEALIAINMKLDQQLDHCNEHAGRGFDIHYHADPVCMYDDVEEGNGEEASPIIGYAADGVRTSIIRYICSNCCC